MVELKVPLGSGRQTSGCRGCGEVFTSITAFDKHWAGWQKRDGKCQPPANVGLVQGENGRWHFPAADEAKVELDNLPDTNDEF